MNADIKRYRDNLRDELNGAALYTALAAAEADPLRKDLFLQLAQAEASHAQLWRDKLAARGRHEERLVAGACSMALGEWLSVTNARELAQTQIAREAEELEQTPLAEQHELALIFQAKGMPKEDAQRVAVQMMQVKEGALDTLAREELGIDPAELGGNAWSAAATSFALFSAGAIFPVAPFFWMRGSWAIGASAAASGAVLCAVGMLTSLFNGRSPWYSAVRQLVFGCLAAGMTYGIGAALGSSLL